MEEKCFCHLNGLAVKDATARKITDNFVTPEMFGAKADGVTDDSAAITAALQVGKPVLMRGAYAVGSTMQGIAPAIYGMDARIILLNDCGILFRLDNAKRVSGLSFRCNDHGVKTCIYTSGVDSVEICDINIQNVKDLRTTSGSSLIAVSGIPVVNIHGIHAENCAHIGNGTIADDAGNLSCIYVSGHTKQCTISGITGKEIHNIDADGNFLFEDSNVIYVQAPDGNAETCIRDVYGYNFGKRLIKTQCGGSVIVDGVTSYTNSLETMAAIGILPGTGTTAGKATITNCSLVNECTDMTNAQYSITTNVQTVINQCILKSEKHWSVYCAGDTNITGCDITGRGVQVAADCNISISDCKFKGTDAVHQYPASTGTITITGSKFSGGHNLDIRNAKLFVTGCRFDYCVCIRVGKYGYIADSYISGYHQTIQVPSEASGAELICKNLTMVAKKHAENEYAIDVRGNTKVVVENLTAIDYMYDVVAYEGTDVYLKGVNMEKVHGKNATTFENYPEYVSELPRPLLTAEGAKVILLTDNKLYKMTSGAWTAVEGAGTT